MLLDTAEENRRVVAPKIAPGLKSQLGQFMTPAPVARFMAEMFPAGELRVCHLLDAGAGLGALTCAFLDRWKAGGFPFAAVHATAHEFDDTLRTHLAQTLSAYVEPGRLDLRIVPGDFIVNSALSMLEARIGRPYSHAILNPPYKKINNDGLHRRALRQVGIETVNLYSAFVALAIELMAPNGVIVAIIPRSFCNGTYYRPFRQLLLRKTAIRRMHLFESRDRAFKDDAVLQENIIVMLERDAEQGEVTITTSTDDTFADLETHVHAFARIVSPGDAEQFIHVPTHSRATELEHARGVDCTLAEIGVSASTGPVVDFRLKGNLRDVPEPGCVPILYPQHFASGNGVTWPILGAKKANAIMVNDETLPWLMPNGFYCVVRRFSSKEERRRIVANVIRPDAFPADTEFLGLENHINVFNDKRRGLPELLAYGVAAYLNTSAVDEAFRRFSGHTQVNAGDLKKLRYPSREVLMELGRWSKESQSSSQDSIDQKFRELTA